jgi:hypothetical protein
MTHTTGARVKETSITTGTGTYTLAGTLVGYRTFAAVATAGAEAYVPYVAVMGADFECGIGRLATNTTLERVKVLESSNAGAAVNWAAGTKVIFMGHGGLSGVPGRHKLGYSTFPTETDNYAQGYGPGSLWIDGVANNSPIWVCLYAGDSGSPDAVWKPLAGSYLDFLRLISSGDPLYTSDAVVLAGEAHWTGDGYAGALASGYGVLVYQGYSTYRGLGDPTGAAVNTGLAQQYGCAVIGNTTNATPAVIYPGADTGAGLIIEQATTWHFTARVIARRPSNGDSKVWRLEGVYQRIGSGNAALIGSLTKTAVAASAGAAAWDIAVAVNTDLYADASGINALELEVTGQAAATINWVADIDVLHNGDGVVLP